MTETTIGLDIESIEHLDFEFAPPCDSRAEGGCDNVAEWKGVLACCGSTMLICQECLDKNDRFMEFVTMMKFKTVRCKTCLAEFPTETTIWVILERL